MTVITKGEIKMTTNQKVMKAAHTLAKKFEGDYQACMAMAMKMAWAIVKKGEGKKNKVNTIQDWFLNKNFKGHDIYFVKNAVYTVNRETEKAYNVTALTSYGFKNFWVPKSVCA